MSHYNEKDEKLDPNVDLSNVEKQGLDEKQTAAVEYHHVDYTEEENKKVLRKIDYRLMPILAVTYGLQFVDKVTLSYAANYGLREDAGLVGDQYNWLASAFYFSYLVFEFPLLAFMQKFPLAKFLGVNIILWGGIVMVHGACHNFAGLMVCRLFLGIFEATVSPGSNMLTGRFYKKRELPFRTSIWVSFNGVGQFLGALIAYGIGNITSTSVASWKLIFIILGGVTVAWGFIVLFFLDSSPVDAKFLDQHERKIAVSRVAENKTGVSSDSNVNKEQIWDAITDPQVILIFFISVAMMIPNGGVTNFLTLIIRGIGYDELGTVLHQLPTGVVQFFLMIAGGLMLSYIPNSRIANSIFWILPALICISLLWTLPRSNTTGLLISTYFLSSFVVTMIAIFSILNTNIAGTTKKSTAHSAYFIGYCVGNIAGPFFFKSSQAPTYDDGCLMMVICSCICIGLLASLFAYYYFENARRRKVLADMGTTIEEHTEEAEQLGLADKTDRENPYFIYSY